MSDKIPDPEAEDGRSEARTWRRIFEEDFRPLELEQRIALARTAGGDNLRAWCFDPSPKVVAALLDNPLCGLEHARLVAQHHRNSVGLDEIGKRAQLLRDTQVQRLLFRNPQLSERLLRRILQDKRMADVYRLALSRDATERVKSFTRRQFRDKFSAGSSEERVSLILRTEGRCLALLIGVPLDGKAAALLCRRPLSSSLLLQNLARWPSTPPQVLQHMARQPAAVRSPALKNLILRHPNAPSQLKNARP